MENCVKDVTAAASVDIHFTPWIISKLMVADEEDEETVRSYSTLLVMTRREVGFWLQTLISANQEKTNKIRKS